MEVSQMTTGEQFYWADTSDDLAEKAVSKAVCVTIQKPRNEVCIVTTVGQNSTVDTIGTVLMSMLAGHKIYLQFSDRSFLALERKGEEIIRECGVVEQITPAGEGSIQ
jgi:hypothetical protein